MSSVEALMWWMGGGTASVETRGHPAFPAAQTCSREALGTVVQRGGGVLGMLRLVPEKGLTSCSGSHVSRSLFRRCGAITPVWAAAFPSQLPLGQG